MTHEQAAMNQAIERAARAVWSVLTRAQREIYPGGFAKVDLGPILERELHYSELVEAAQAVIDKRCYEHAPSAGDRLRAILTKIKGG